MIVMDEKTLKLIEDLGQQSENDLHVCDDFAADEVRPAIDGIRWFAQEWLPNHVNK